MTKTIVEAALINEGKKKDPTFDKFAIRYHVGKHHVGLSDEEVEKDLRYHIGQSKDAWPKHVADRACKYAIDCHHNNQDLYGKVMRGEFSEAEEINVVTNVYEGDRTELFNILNAVVDQKPIDFQEAFKAILNPRLIESVEVLKEDIKKSIFKDKNQDSDEDEENVEEALNPVADKMLAELVSKDNVGKDSVAYKTNVHYRKWYDEREKKGLNKDKKDKENK